MRSEISYKAIYDDDYISHYGVLGMRWGHRKAPQRKTIRQRMGERYKRKEARGQISSFAERKARNALRNNDVASYNAWTGANHKSLQSAKTHEKARRSTKNAMAMDTLAGMELGGIAALAVTGAAVPPAAIAGAGVGLAMSAGFNIKAMKDRKKAGTKYRDYTWLNKGDKHVG